MFIQAIKQDEPLSLLRKQVVKLVNLDGYCTVEKARETVGGWMVKVRMCGKHSDLTFEVKPQEIIQLPTRLQLIEKHYP